METLKFINGHPIKRALICYVLLKNGPQTRIPIMKAVHALENSKYRFSPTSNIMYWLKNKLGNPYIRRESEQSVLVRGLVQRIGTANRFHVYGLTEKGLALAKQVQEHYGH